MEASNIPGPQEELRWRGLSTMTQMHQSPGPVISFRLNWQQICVLLLVVQYRSNILLFYLVAKENKKGLFLFGFCFSPESKLLPSCPIPLAGL